MPSNREITFVLKVQNDAKQGLQSVGVDFDALARRVNDLGNKQGASAQRGLTGIQAQAKAIRELVAAYRLAAVAQERLSRLQAQNRSANRVSTARARDAENATKIREAERLFALQNKQRIGEERLAAAAERTAQVRKLSQDAQTASQSRTVSAQQIAASNAQTTLALNQLRTKEAQLKVDRASLRVQQEQARLDGIIAANKAKAVAASQAQLTLQQRTAAAAAQTARQQALAAAAAARNTGGGGGGAPRGPRGGGGGIFGGFFSGFLGGRGAGLGAASAGGAIGGGGNVWGGLGTGSQTAALGLGKLRSAAIALGAALSVSKLVEYADTFKLLNARVGIVTDSVLQQRLVFEGLTRVANESRVGLQEVNTVYYGLARNNQALGLSQNQLLSITETINKSIAVSGTNAQAAAFGLIQLSQAFGTGQLRGEELNSVLEQLPALAQTISRNVRLMNGTIGVGTPGALKTLAEQGKLTIPQIIDALQRGAADLDAEFSKIPPTVSQGITTIKNGLTVFVGELDKALGFTTAVAKQFQEFGKSLASSEFRDSARDIGNSILSVAQTVYSVLEPLGSFIKDNFSAIKAALQGAIVGLGAYYIALIASGAPLTGFLASVRMASVAIVAFGRAAVINAALIVSWSRTMGVGRTAASLFGIAATSAAAGVRTLTAASMAFIRTPLGIALMAAATAAGIFYAAFNKGSDEAANSLAESRRSIQGLRTELDDLEKSRTKVAGKGGVSLLAPLTDAQQEQKAQIIQSAQETKQALAREEQEILRQIGKTRSIIDEERKKSTTSTNLNSGATYTFNTAAYRQAAQDLQTLTTNLEGTRAQIAETSALLERAGADSLDILPARSGVDPSSELQGVFDTALRGISPLAAKIRETNQELLSMRSLFKDGVVSFEAFENGTARDSNWLKQLTVDYLNLNSVADATQEKQYEVLTAIMAGAEALSKDNAISQAVRQGRVELNMLRKEAEEGVLPIERKLLEVAKQIAEEEGGRFANPEAYMGRVRAALQEQYVQQEIARLSAEITADVKERQAAIQSQVALAGANTAELRAEAEIEKRIAEARAKNARLSKEQEQSIRNIKTDLVAINNAEIAATVFTSLKDEIYKTGLEKERLDLLFSLPPDLNDSERAYIDFLFNIAEQAKISYAEVLKLMNAGKSIDLGNGRSISSQDIQEGANTVRENTTANTQGQAKIDAVKQLQDMILLEAENTASVGLGTVAAARRREQYELMKPLMDSGLTALQAQAVVAEQLATLDAQRLETARQSQGTLGMINGAKRGFQEFITEAMDTSTQFAEITKNAFSGISNAIAEWVTTGKANFKELTASILRDIATMIVKFLVLKAIMAALNFVSPGLGDTIGKMAGMASAKGNVFEAGKHVQKYARGGLVTKPTFFPMANGGLGLMGEAGAEAIMPLRRLSNGRLGVESAGGGATNNVFAPTISIVVEGGSGKDGEAREDMAKNIGDQVNKIMEAKMAEFAQRQSRNGGMLRTALEL